MEHRYQSTNFFSEKRRIKENNFLYNRYNIVQIAHFHCLQNKIQTDRKKERKKNHSSLFITEKTPCLAWHPTSLFSIDMYHKPSDSYQSGAMKTPGLDWRVVPSYGCLPRPTWMWLKCLGWGAMYFWLFRRYTQSLDALSDIVDLTHWLSNSNEVLAEQSKSIISGLGDRDGESLVWDQSGLHGKTLSQK